MDKQVALRLGVRVDRQRTNLGDVIRRQTHTNMVEGEDTLPASAATIGSSDGPSMTGVGATRGTVSGANCFCTTWISSARLTFSSVTLMGMRLISGRVKKPPWQA